ncbi:hypothetical protein MTR_3g010760 [Medicago truncatula]|uniref:Uncharacterized protein n=1 Tax=Medicago truncatula TaxID=3880 RepID=G7IVH4_MEDTR|nr:hypothetical protein MTR_3g010760 [Medicago truncatula]
MLKFDFAVNQLAVLWLPKSKSYELSLDEPDLEVGLYLVDGNGGEEIETINVN